MNDQPTVSTTEGFDEQGGSFVDLLIALVIISFTAIASLESRHHALKASQTLTELLHRTLETTHTHPLGGERCVTGIGMVICNGDSNEKKVYLITP